MSQAVVVRAQAATWAASQISGGAIMACDPAMCAVLAQHGIAGGNLLMLRPGSADPLGSDVVLATAAVRDMFGARLESVYAPELLASFGTGPARIDIRAIEPDGSAAYRDAIAADLRARLQAGSELLRDPLIAYGAGRPRPAGDRSSRHAPADHPGYAGGERAAAGHGVPRRRPGCRPGPTAASRRADRQ